MPTIEPRVIPDDYYSFNLKDLNTLIVAIERLVQAKEVMRIDQAVDFLGISRRHIDEMCRQGKLPFHRLESLGGKLFLRSELIAFIKAS